MAKTATVHDVKGWQIRAARCRLGLSQRELAARAGVAPGVVTRLESIDGYVTGDRWSFAAVMGVLKQRVIFIEADSEGGAGVREK